MRRIGFALALTILALAGTAGIASAKPATHSALLTQTAQSAALSAPGATRLRGLVLSHAAARVLAVADRPSRDSGMLTAGEYRSLWAPRGTFRRDHPNAILTGTTATGTLVRVPLVLYSARGIGSGMRYTVRTLSPSSELALTGVSLFIDNVNIAFATDSADVFAPGTLTIGTGQTQQVQCLDQVQVLNLDELQIGAGGTLSLVGAGDVSLTALALYPQRALNQVLQVTGGLTVEYADASPWVPATWALSTVSPTGAGTITLTSDRDIILSTVTLQCS
jgi:hypothetical protein